MALTVMLILSNQSESAQSPTVMVEKVRICRCTSPLARAIKIHATPVFLCTSKPQHRSETPCRVITLGEQAFAQALAEGRAMTPEQALAAQGHTLLASHPPERSIPSAPGDQQHLPSSSPPND